jgi:hypothetical protein
MMKPIKNNWMKVCKETPPPYNERVLIWTGYEQYIATYIQENKFRIFDYGTKATHWDWLGRPPEKENVVKDGWLKDDLDRASKRVKELGIAKTALPPETENER